MSFTGSGIRRRVSSVPVRLLLRVRGSRARRSYGGAPAGRGESPGRAFRPRPPRARWSRGMVPVGGSPVERRLVGDCPHARAPEPPEAGRAGGRPPTGGRPIPSPGAGRTRRAAARRSRRALVIGGRVVLRRCGRSARVRSWPPVAGAGSRQRRCDPERHAPAERPVIHGSPRSAAGCSRGRPAGSTRDASGRDLPARLGEHLGRRHPAIGIAPSRCHASTDFPRTGKRVWAALRWFHGPGHPREDRLRRQPRPPHPRSPTAWNPTGADGPQCGGRCGPRCRRDFCDSPRRHGRLKSGACRTRLD